MFTVMRLTPRMSLLRPQAVYAISSLSSSTTAAASKPITTASIAHRPPFFLNVSQGQSRRFNLDSLLSTALGACPRRKLTHSKVIAHSAAAVFKAVSDVSGYPAFLPFTISSHVTARDGAGYPTKARLKVGYDKFGLEEDWDSLVRCDPVEGVVEARSSESVSDGGGLFEVLQTRWHIVEAGAPTRNDRPTGDPVTGTGTGTGSGTGGPQSTVTLNVEVKFRNPVYDQMFAQVEHKVAAAMISAFEKRVGEIEGQQHR